MKNLFKNTFRNLAKSKITLVSLSFLVFLAIGIFTLLSSTTKNITNTYNEISKKGNLHDFTVSEQYSLGNTDYGIYGYDQQHQTGGTDNDNQFWGYSTEGDGSHIVIPWVHVNGDGDRVWQSCFTSDLCSPEDALYKIWDKYSKISLKDFPQLKQLLFPQTIVSASASLPNELTYMQSPSSDHVSTLSFSNIKAQIDQQLAIDGVLINKSSKEAGDDLYAYVQTNNTPMQNYLDEQKVDYRKFTSLDINQSPDNIYYKNIESNPEDSIDKMVLFNYKGKDSGESLFSTHDFNPNNVWNDPLIQSKFSTLDSILKYDLPSQAPNKGDLEYNIAIAKFKILAYGVNTGTVTFADLADGTFTQYSDYITLQGSQIVIDTGYKISVEWGGLVPSNCTITDWTSIFSVVSPEYMKEKNLSTFNYSSYFNVTSRQELIDKLNVFNTDPKKDLVHEALLDIASKFPTSTITVGGGMPYIILGVGITPDFIYPIVNIANPNPNPSKQCIFYSNNSGFERTYDSFKTCPSERYLVCDFNSTNSNKQKNQLREYNDQAASLMNFPIGTRAVYMYNDTTDFLNASAFRIAYIPKLVEKIVLVDYLLTFSVLILSLFVASIVISNYIQKQRKVLGVMRANGIRKREIAFSLLPFALLPTIAGTTVGYLTGLFAQLPFLSLFKDYWMIPTQTFSFAITTFLISMLIPFALFTLVAWTTTYLTLKINTVDLMKSGSEYKVNIVQKYVKKPFRHFNILTRFRVSIAFNSIAKILVLFATATLTMTTLIFATSNAGKFNEARDNTFNSRNYAYSIDLYTPTIESGQYVPTAADYYGDSGFLESTEGENFMPGSYFLDNSLGTKVVDTGYSEVFNGDEKNNSIIKNYYEDSGRTLTSLDPTIFADNGNLNAHQNLILPMSGDSSGQTADLQYLKNRFLDKNSMDMTVGLSPQTTNPWNIALSLMPENQSNLINSKEQFVLNAAGWKLHAKDIYDKSGDNLDTKILSPYVSYGSDGKPDWASDDWLKSDGTPKYSWGDHLQCGILNQAILQNKTIQEIKYGIQSPSPLENEVNDFNFFVSNPAPVPFGVGDEYVNLNTAINTDLFVPTTSNVTPFAYSFTPSAADIYFSNIDRTVDINLKATDFLYYVSYGTVPLANDDETYTYLNITHPDNNISARVTGIKENSTFVNLLDKNGKNINSLLNLKNNKYNTNIIVNSYAAKKYNYKVGQAITLNVQNKTDRIRDQMLGIDNNSTLKFNVVGISTSANDEEYFMNQECANSILGLKNTLDGYNGIQPHTYYTKMYDPNGVSSSGARNIAIAASMIRTSLDASTGTFFGAKNRASITGNDTIPTIDDATMESDLVDLSSVDNERENINVTANGFNGVFTKHSNGSELLNNRIPLYSPSGLYPASSVVSNDTMDTLLRYGSNLQIASQMIGLYKATSPDVDNAAVKLGQDIYKNWYDNFATKNVNDRKAALLTTTSTYYKNLDVLIPEFVALMNQYYGNSAYTSLITNAIDRDSSGIIFDNLSSTITEIESVIISILIIMVLLIIILISLMVINDAKGLAATMKALGYRDHQNIASFLAIYVPVILLSIIVSIPLGYGVVSLFNLIMLNGTKIYLTSHLTLTNTIISVLYSLIAFGVSGVIGYWSLKNERLVERLKQ